MPQKHLALGLGIVGIGKIARDQHIPSIRENPDFELAATASRNPKATVGGVPAYRDLAGLLAGEPGISCISLCTPPQARYADARLALEAGRHVMLEKPPGATLGEVHDLAALARANSLSLQTTWHSRESAAVDAARDWLAGRRILRMHIDWKEDVRLWHPGQDWVWQAGGLGVFDPGINALSVMTRILPHPVHLRAAELHVPENRETPVAAELSFHAPGEPSLTAAFDWLEQGTPKWNIHVVTDQGEAMLSEGGARLTIDGTEAAQGDDREYPRLYKRFAELVRARESEIDLSPMRHVADAFTLGRIIPAAPFNW